MFHVIWGVDPGATQGVGPFLGRIQTLSGSLDYGYLVSDASGFILNERGRLSTFLTPCAEQGDTPQITGNKN